MQILPRQTLRSQDTISAELHAYQEFRWAIVNALAEFNNCQLRPIVICDGAVLPQPLPETPPDIRDALAYVNDTIARLECELVEAYERFKALSKSSRY
jgi:hypothetical protein